MNLLATLSLLLGKGDDRGAITIREVLWICLIILVIVVIMLLLQGKHIFN